MDVRAGPGTIRTAGDTRLGSHTPVHATVDGVSWKTSVWRDKTGRTLLAVPNRARGTKGDGDAVKVRITFSTL